ncbi:apolipoprotein N-acyltransferase [Halothiobacillus diazotrophicus]|uniref:Apolipoprotein N-acyltransferase n=1 Tax=Halothiobacillus diazotrophicus TaxID=1860122 RepID=A0A191ZEY0_9GAMM|nr:apolipoprotein N-acyltransferase [Halothiobacillus diazotrophicus]ANJ66428.1 apolipoprotein N-acyltransferase [Halothiobacillus diazotrophicus]
MRLASDVPSLLRFRWRLFWAFLAGAVLPVGFAPLDFWPVTILSPAILLLLLIGQSAKRGFWIGYAFALGQFGIGVSWVYLSLTLFGGAIAPIAALITLLFVGALALYGGLTTWLAVRAGGIDSHQPVSGRAFLWLSMAFIGSWAFVEWLRGWILSGFPWLDLGVAQVASPLGGYLPLFGEYGVTLIVLSLSVLLAWIGLELRRRSGLGPQIGVWVSVAGVVAILLAGMGLGRIQWTQPVGQPLLVGVAQANVPQMQKFDPAFLNQTLHTYLALSDGIGAADLVIWPETAIPDVLSDLDWFRQILDQRARDTGVDYLVGTFTQDRDGHYFNSLVGIPGRIGSHSKAHLVPFSEYMPLRPLMDLFSGLIDIPMSDLTPGAVDQPLPVVKGVRIGPSICYEADFARDIRHDLPDAGILVNVSNDSWFGDSLAPHQNLQMAAVRAREFGRPLVRATNTGISAFIDARGRPYETLGVDRQGFLKADVQPYQGTTPFYHLQSWPIILLSVLLWGGAGLLRRRNPYRD